MSNQSITKEDVDYENDFKVVIANQKINTDQLKVHQLKSLESFSRSSESLALSVTSIGDDNTKPGKERRKKKTRSASRGKKDEREQACDGSVSRDTGESFMSAIMASVKREGWNKLGDNEEERQRLMNMRLEGKLSVSKQTGDELIKERFELICQLEVAKKEIEGNKTRLLSIEEKNRQFYAEKEKIKEYNVDLEKHIADLRIEIGTKSKEVEEVKQSLEVYKETMMFQEQNALLVKADVAMKEAVIGDLKKKVCELNSQLELIKLYRENSEYQAEQARLEVEKAYNSRKFMEEQLHSVENIRDKLQAEVQRVRRSLDNVCSERDLLDQKSQTFELKLAKLQASRLHETTQLLFELEQLQKEIIINSNEKDALEERYEALSIVFEEKSRDFENERLRTESLQKQCNDLSQQFEEANTKLERSQTNLELFETEAKELTTKVASLEVTLAQKLIEIETLQSEKKLLQESIQEWKGVSEQRESRILFLDEELTNVRNSLNRVCQERDQSNMFIERLRDDCERVTEQFDVTRQNLCSKDASLRLMEEINEEMKAQLANENEKIVSQNSVIDILQMEKENLISSCDLMERNHSEVLLELENLRVSLGEARTTIEIMEEKLRVAGSENRRLCDDHERAESDMNKLKSELVEVKNMLEKLNEVQKEYCALLERYRDMEEQFHQLSEDHMTSALDWQRKNDLLEYKLFEREQELERIVSQKEEVVQTSQRDLQALERKSTYLLESLENVKFNQAIELAKKEEQYREQLEMSEKEFSQMCQEKIRCESAIESLQNHINVLVDDYNKRLNEYKTKMLTLEKKSTAYEEYENKSRELLEELERRKGEIEGILEQWKKMKEHSSKLENALAKREANIVEIVQKYSVMLDEKDINMKELRRDFREEQEKRKIESSRNEMMVSQIQQQISLIDSANLKLRSYEKSLFDINQDLDEKKRIENLLIEEKRILQDTQREMAKELERRSYENCELMKKNISLKEEIMIVRDSKERENKKIGAIQQELEQKSQRIEDSNKKREKLVQRHKEEKKQMKCILKDVQQENESLTRTTELSQQREIIATSVLSHLRSEVERIMFKENICTDNNNSLSKLSDENLQQLHLLMKETEAPIKATKPLSRLSKCIEDLRSQIDSMQEVVIEQFKEESISEDSK